MPTFDIVSELDRQEILNAVDQARRELANRFDFKGSEAKLEIEKDGNLRLTAEDASRLKGLRKRIKKFKKATEKEQELSDSMRATLRSYYRADVEKLSHLLGRDLMYWVAEPKNEENGGGP